MDLDKRDWITERHGKTNFKVIGACGKAYDVNIFGEITVDTGEEYVQLSDAESAVWAAAYGAINPFGVFELMVSNNESKYGMERDETRRAYHDLIERKLIVIGEGGNPADAVFNALAQVSLYSFDEFDYPEIDLPYFTAVKRSMASGCKQSNISNAVELCRQGLSSMEELLMALDESNDKFDLLGDLLLMSGYEDAQGEDMRREIYNFYYGEPHGRNCAMYLEAAVEMNGIYFV